MIVQKELLLIEQLMASGERLDDLYGEEDLDAASDPVNAMDLVEYLGTYVRAFVAQDQRAFEQCVQGLSPKQATAVRKMLTPAP